MCVGLGCRVMAAMPIPVLIKSTSMHRRLLLGLHGIGETDRNLYIHSTFILKIWNIKDLVKEHLQMPFEHSIRNVWTGYTHSNNSIITVILVVI